MQGAEPAATAVVKETTAHHVDAENSLTIGVYVCMYNVCRYVYVYVCV